MTTPPPLTPAQCALIRACTYSIDRTLLLIHRHGGLPPREQADEVDWLIEHGYLYESAYGVLTATMDGLNAATVSGG
jgi:hypothetical protein